MSTNGIKFEAGFMQRNNRSVTTNNSVALTEFIANAWDAGAHNVNITIPDNENGQIIVEDDGTGLSDEEFRSRCLTLNYNRQAHQGKWVKFPGNESGKRMAYGRNGIGRHGMFCFADSYTVETWQNGMCNEYRITVSEGDSPYELEKLGECHKDGHGTKISAFLTRNLPNIEQMTDILSARFMSDPNFALNINNKKVDLLEHKGLVSNKEVMLSEHVKAKILIIDSSKTFTKSQQHGVAFWVSGRLVGNPSWSYGNITFLDGRVKAAKKYTIIVQSDDLINDVMPDWTGFIQSPSLDLLMIKVKSEVDNFLRSVMSEQIEEIKQEVIEDKLDDFRLLNVSGQRETSEFIEKITTVNPFISTEFIKSAIDAFVKIEKSKSGETLLRKISQMSLEELDMLSDLLTSWDINDIAYVMNEIDRRIIVVEAIDKVYREKSTDELHTLHPLVLNARWIFGSQFDSPMFTSNSTLSTVVKTLFKEHDYDLEPISNIKKRPDIVCLKKSTFSFTCTDRADPEANNLLKPDQILIVELKKGGFPIGFTEIGQAENYVRQIRKSGCLHKAASIDAYVVGASIDDVDSDRTTDSGRIHVITYGHLVDTAQERLFRLRDKLREHYDSLGKESIVEKALRADKQIKMQ